MISPIARALLRLAPESYLMKHGLWDECSGDPINLEAQEFDRRDYGWPNYPSAAIAMSAAKDINK